MRREDPEQPAVRQGPRQELPAGPPPRPRLRDQQEEPAHEGPPGLKRAPRLRVPPNRPILPPENPHAVIGDCV